MDNITIIFIVLSLAISVGIAYFQYYFKSKRIGKVTLFLFVLRSLVFFSLFLLLINPSIESKVYKSEKPVLQVLTDNSKSTGFLKQDGLAKSILNYFRKNSILNNRFNINYYTFGNNLLLNDSTSFDESQTNIYNALKLANDLDKNNNGAIVLLSDGNQTVGNDYEYVNSKKEIYPIILGDTTQYEDVSISQLNVNRYSFLKNQFPLEAFVLYQGSNDVRARFTIENRGKVVFSKTLALNKNKTTQRIQANILSDREGVNFYTAKIQYLANEKNRINNVREFSMEVIDKQSKILLLSSINHPDLGALKKSIETDKQRKVDIKLINSEEIQLNDYQLLILYQPNFEFQEVLSIIQKNKINAVIITGTKTDWRFLNTQNLGITKNSIDQSEQFEAKHNPGYLVFSQKNIGFESFPPLTDKFGQVKVAIPHQILLYQSVNGFSSQEPLLFSVNENNHKKVFLLGEGLWKWRSASFLNTNSFTDFDTFIGSLTQYSSSKKIRNRLDVDLERTYNANEKIRINAFYVNENYEFDDRATLLLTLKNKETNKTTSFPFSLVKNSYELTIEALSSGEYEYTVTVQNQNISRKGILKVNNFSIEEQFINPNKDKLSRLADNSSGKTFYGSNYEEIINDLLENKKYVIIQKEITKNISIIDWYWLLLFISGLLAIEWFVRKYHGKI